MPKRTRSIKTSDQRGNKPWLRRQSPYVYGLNSKSKNRTFLIICEGQTEEQYFNSFPVLAATVKSIHTGSSKTTLVDTVVKYMRGQSYDEVWCVFDLDFDPKIPGQVEDFNRAIKKAREKGYHCAYSNDSFELWFVLHYQYLDQQQHRGFYCELLSRRWNLNYSREGKVLRFTKGIYTLLQEDQAANQQKAIDHARKLLLSQEAKAYHLQNPVTTVFQLVERLNEHCRK